VTNQMLGFMRYPPSPLVESPPILRAANRLVHAIVSSTLLIQFVGTTKDLLLKFAAKAVRRSEVVSLPWSDIDGEVKGGRH